MQHLFVCWCICVRFGGSRGPVEASFAISSHPRTPFGVGWGKNRGDVCLCLLFSLILSLMFTWAIQDHAKQSGGMKDDLEFEVLHCNILAHVCRVARNNDMVTGLSDVFGAHFMIYPGPLQFQPTTSMMPFSSFFPRTKYTHTKYMFVVHRLEVTILNQQQ